MNTDREFRRLRAVVLDWAGTTVDHGSRAVVLAAGELFRRHGVHLSEAEIREPVGLAEFDYVRVLIFEPDIAERWLDANGSAPTEAGVEDLDREFEALLLDVLPAHSELIAGTLEAVQEIRVMGLAIGSTTGYSRAAAERIRSHAAVSGYEPDVVVCASDVPVARPEPWMLWRAMEALRVFPPATVVKVGDTVADVDEGRNAGTWTVAVAATGNEVGLSAEEMRHLSTKRRRNLIEAARLKLSAASPDFVVESIAQVPGVLTDIEHRLERGEQPEQSIRVFSPPPNQPITPAG